MYIPIYTTEALVRDCRLRIFSVVVVALPPKSPAKTNDDLVAKSSLQLLTYDSMFQFAYSITKS